MTTVLIIYNLKTMTDILSNILKTDSNETDKSEIVNKFNVIFEIFVDIMLFTNCK